MVAPVCGNQHGPQDGCHTPQIAGVMKLLMRLRSCHRAARIGFQEFVGLISLLLNCRRQRFIGAPETGAGPMHQSSLQRPAKIHQGLLGQPVQGARLNVLFQFLLPVGSVKALEPGPELGPFSRWELRHRSFNGLDAFHGLRLIGIWAGCLPGLIQSVSQGPWSELSAFGSLIGLAPSLSSDSASRYFFL